MAHISEYWIVSYQRQPGHWRAAIRPKKRAAGIYILGKSVDTFVTPDDYASEPDATVAAEQLIGKL